MFNISVCEIRFAFHFHCDIGYLSEKVRCSEAIVFRCTPATYDYSWHNAPRRLVLLSATLSTSLKHVICLISGISHCVFACINITVFGICSLMLRWLFFFSLHFLSFFMHLSIYSQFLYFCQYYLYNNIISVSGCLVCKF